MEPSESFWAKSDIFILENRIKEMQKAITLFYDFENINSCVEEDRKAVEIAMWAMKHQINKYKSIIAESVCILN